METRLAASIVGWIRYTRGNDTGKVLKRRHHVQRIACMSCHNAPFGVFGGTSFDRRLTRSSQAFIKNDGGTAIAKRNEIYQTIYAE